jgi:hypothetical protein
MALPDHPNFRTACEQNAGRIVALRDSFRPIFRWLSNDVGRTVVLSRAFMWDARDGGVTVAEVLASTRARGTVSDGRVLQLFRRAEAAGVIVTEPGPGAWQNRRLVFRPEYVEAIRARVVAEIETASLVIPSVRAAAALMVDDFRFGRFLAHMARYHVAPPETMGPRNPSIRLFLEHSAGLAMLYDLIGRQKPDRDRLLEAAPFSRTALSRRHGVSRSHVTRLFEAASEAGYLSSPTRNRVVFSQVMSEEAERHFALTFHVIASSAHEAMDDLAAPSPRLSKGAGR